MPKVARQWLHDILRLIYQQRTVTRADIIDSTGLNPASVSHTLRRLLDRGTILKVGELRSKGGRPREVFSLNGEAGFFVAVDLEGRTIRFGLANLVGDIRYRWEEDLDYGRPLPMQKVVESIERVLGNLSPAQLDRVLAVGVSYPGLMNSDGGLTAVNLGWRAFPLAAQLRSALDHPIFLEHDKHSCVLAERWLGCARGYDNGFFLIVERGIGLGVFIDGRPVQGARDMTGEIGHCKIDPSFTELCSCGQRGCLETVASSPSIIREYSREAALSAGEQARLRIGDVFERARQRHEAAVRVVGRAGRAIGRALSHAVSLLNPQIIILGGDLIGAEDVLGPCLRAELQRSTLPLLTQGLEIRPSVLGLDIRLKGAASLAFRRALSDPQLLGKICEPAAGG